MAMVMLNVFFFRLGLSSLRIVKHFTGRAADTLSPSLKCSRLCSEIQQLQNHQNWLCRYMKSHFQWPRLLCVGLCSVKEAKKETHLTGQNSTGLALAGNSLCIFYPFQKILLRFPSIPNPLRDHHLALYGKQQSWGRAVFS